LRLNQAIQSAQSELHLLEDRLSELRAQELHASKSLSHTMSRIDVAEKRLDELIDLADSKVVEVAQLEGVLNTRQAELASLPPSFSPEELSQLHSLAEITARLESDRASLRSVHEGLAQAQEDLATRQQLSRDIADMEASLAASVAEERRAVREMLEAERVELEQKRNDKTLVEQELSAQLVACAEAQQRRAHLEQRVQLLEEQGRTVHEANQRAEELQRNLEQVQNQLYEKNDAAARAMEQAQLEADVRVADVKREVESLQARLATKEAELASLKEQLAEARKQASASGSNLSSSFAPATEAAKAAAVSASAEEEQERLDALVAAREDLQAQLAREQAALEQARGELDATVRQQERMVMQQLQRFAKTSSDVDQTVVDGSSSAPQAGAGASSAAAVAAALEAEEASLRTVQQQVRLLQAEKRALKEELSAFAVACARAREELAREVEADARAVAQSKGQVERARRYVEEHMPLRTPQRSQAAQRLQQRLEQEQEEEDARQARTDAARAEVLAQRRRDASSSSSKRIARTSAADRAREKAALDVDTVLRRSQRNGRRSPSASPSGEHRSTSPLSHHLPRARSASPLRSSPRAASIAAKVLGSAGTLLLDAARLRTEEEHALMQRAVAELHEELQRAMASAQEEGAALHERNTELRSEVLEAEERLRTLRQKLEQAEAAWADVVARVAAVPTPLASGMAPSVLSQNAAAGVVVNPSPAAKRFADATGIFVATPIRAPSTPAANGALPPHSPLPGLSSPFPTLDETSAAASQLSPLQIAQLLQRNRELVRLHSVLLAQLRAVCGGGGGDGAVLSVTGQQSDLSSLLREATAAISGVSVASPSSSASTPALVAPLPHSAFLTLQDLYLSKEAHWAAQVAALRMELRKRDEEAAVLLRDLLHRIDGNNATDHSSSSSVRARLDAVENTLTKLAQAVDEAEHSQQQQQQPSSVLPSPHGELFTPTKLPADAPTTTIGSPFSPSKRASATSTLYSDLLALVAQLQSLCSSAATAVRLLPVQLESVRAARERLIPGSDSSSSADVSRSSGTGAGVDMHVALRERDAYIAFLVQVIAQRLSGSSSTSNGANAGAALVALLPRLSDAKRKPSSRAIGRRKDDEEEPAERDQTGSTDSVPSSSRQEQTAKFGGGQTASGAQGKKSGAASAATGVQEETEALQPTFDELYASLVDEPAAAATTVTKKPAKAATDFFAAEWDRGMQQPATRRASPFVALQFGDNIPVGADAHDDDVADAEGDDAASDEGLCAEDDARAAAAAAKAVQADRALRRQATRNPLVEPALNRVVPRAREVPRDHFASPDPDEEAASRLSNVLVAPPLDMFAPSSSSSGSAGLSSASMRKNMMSSPIRRSSAPAHTAPLVSPLALSLAASSSRSSGNTLSSMRLGNGGSSGNGGGGGGGFVPTLSFGRFSSSSSSSSSTTITTVTSSSALATSLAAFAAPPSATGAGGSLSIGNSTAEELVAAAHRRNLLAARIKALQSPNKARN
jgi:hypothetical protein